MVEQDTVKLLRECDAGVKMGVASIEDVIDRVENEEMRKHLRDSKQAHEKLDGEIGSLLRKYEDEGKEPAPIAKTMSKMKTNMKMSMEESDATVADLITDGCNMGIKSLYKYLNQYPAADKTAKELCNRLIDIEEELRKGLREYL